MSLESLNLVEPSMQTLVLVSREEIAHRLGVTPRTIQRWQQDEGLPVIAIGKFRRYIPEQVHAWLLKKQRGA